MADAVAEPKVQDTAPEELTGYDAHIGNLLIEEEDEDLAQEEENEDVEQVDAETTEGQDDEQKDEGATNSKVEEADKDGAEEEKKPATPEELQAKLEELEKKLAEKDDEVAKKQKSIDEQGNRFMGTKQKIEKLEQSLAIAQDRIKKLGDAPDHLDDFKGATKHVQQQNALESQVQREGAELQQLKQQEARANIEFQAAKEFAPEHTDMVEDLHALWKKDVPKYSGSVEQFQNAMYRDIPASTIISMVKRVQAEQKAEELEKKLSGLMDKFGKAGKPNKKLVGAGSGGASARPGEDTEQDSDDVTDLFGSAEFAKQMR